VDVVCHRNWRIHIFSKRLNYSFYQKTLVKEYTSLVKEFKSKDFVIETGEYTSLLIKA
jgi:hypothetical protein